MRFLHVQEVRADCSSESTDRPVLEEPMLGFIIGRRRLPEPTIA